MNCKGKCDSTGPNCVWSTYNVNNLPKGTEIRAQNYTGVSIDIEGLSQEVQTDPSEFAIALKTKIKEWKKANLSVMLTIPGFGVKKYDSGGNPIQNTYAMGWFDEVKSLVDYVCLMFYSKINDTMAQFDDVPIAGIHNLETALSTLWSGTK